MKLRQLQSLKTRAVLKIALVSSGGLLLLGIFVKLFFISRLFEPGTSLGASCESSYTLDWGNPSTYTVTCGSVNSGNWSVKGATCSYYSPLFNNSGGYAKSVSIAVRINQSGNLENNDTAWAFFYVNGISTHTDIFKGNGSTAVFTSSFTAVVPAASTYQLSIKLKNDLSNELWQIKNGDVTFCINTISPLPVSFTSFTADVHGSSVFLNWTTQAETNNAYFTIERSKDGISFSEFKRQAGAGNSTSAHRYAITDASPFPGTSYYRLKQTDVNGKTNTFKAVAVTLKNDQAPASTVNAFPNPFTTFFMIEFNSSEKKVALFEILNTNSILVHSEKIPVSEGMNAFRFNAPSNFKPGCYLWRLTSSSFVIGEGSVICK